LRRFSHGLFSFSKIEPAMNPQDTENKIPAKHTPDMDSTLPPGADAEERFNEFWRVNGTSIFIAIAVGAVIVLGAQTWRYVSARREASLQKAYAAAQTQEELLTFAGDHSKHALAGAAYLRVAGDEYTAGKYIQAAEHYKMAVEHLAGTPFLERASLGAAMSELLGGQTSEGVASLTAIMNTPDFLEITRAEAAFNLALHYLKVQDYKALATVCDFADSLGEKDMYASMTRGMRNQIPLETK
jgi:hypothetical protein